MGRQYIGEIGKTDNGIVVVTTHLYDGRKSLPLDIELYQPASSLTKAKQDEEFKKKPELALNLIERSLDRGKRPGIVIIDSGYGNNTTFLIELEKRQLSYLGGLEKSRQVVVEKSRNCPEKIRLDKLAQSLPDEAFTPIELKLEKPRIVWVATIEVELSRLFGKRTVAIVMNASTFTSASDIDYLITNIEGTQATAEWIVTTYSQKNWVEVFYREALVMARIKRISSQGEDEPTKTFCFGVLCLYFYFMAYLNRRTKKALEQQTFNHFS